MNGVPARFSFPIVLLLLLILPACGGGGGSSAPTPTPDAPTVLDVFPKALSARSGSTVRFIAQTSAQASSYAWDFGAGATPSTSTLTQPLVLLGDPGTYTATLIVCAAECAAPFQFTYTVDPANPAGHQLQILSVTPSGTAGPRATDVQFEAQLAGDADFWEWDFGTGTLQQFSTDAQPIVTLYREGIHEGQVTARLSGGSEASLAFAYEVSRGSVESPPIIDALVMDGIWACDNKQLVFDPGIISDFPVSYDWIFDGGLSRGTSANSVVRALTIAPGIYHGELRVQNQFGAASPRAFEYTIVTCPDVTADVVESDQAIRGIVAIDSTITGTVGRTFTDFSAPAFFQKTAGANLGLTRIGPGNVSVALSASSKLAKWAVGDTAHISVDVQYPGPAPVWQRAHLVDDFEFLESSGLGVLGDRPMVGYFLNDTQAPVLSIAKHANPSGPADWTTIRFNEPEGLNLPEFHLSAGDGRPVMFVTDLRQHVWTSSTTDPQRPDDFVNFSVARPTNWSHWSQPRDVGGRIILAATHSSEAGLIIQQTTTVHPVGPADFTTVEVLLGNPLATSTWSIADWHGNPVILLGPEEADTVSIAASRVPVPLTDTDFAIYNLPGTNRNEGDQPGGLLFGGSSRLWLFAPTFETPWLNFSTTVAWPQSASDWTFDGEFSGGPPTRGLLSELDGRLVWVDPLFNPQVHAIRRALVPAPTSSRDWFFCATEQADAAAGFLANSNGEDRAVVAGDRLFVLYKNSNNGTRLLLDSTRLTW